MVRTSTDNKQPGYALHAPPSGQGGAPGGARDTARRFSPCGPAPLVLALRGMLGPSSVCGAHRAAPPLPGLGPLRLPLARAAVGLRLPFRHRCAGQPVARLAALPIGRAPARRSGRGGPPPPSLRRGLRPLGGSGPGSLGSGHYGPRRKGSGPPPCGRPLRSGALACAVAPPRCPGGRLPPAALVSLAPPAGGRGGCGRGQARAFYGFAAAARPARRVSAAAGKITLVVLLWTIWCDMITIVVQLFDERSFLC